MLKNIKNRLINNSLLKTFLLVSFVLIIFFIPNFIKTMPYYRDYDFFQQWLNFYEEYYSMLEYSIENKTLPFYSWHLFLGNNFWASKSYYLVGDIFAYIGFLFRKLGMIKVMTILAVLKYYVSAFTMNRYMKKCGFKNNTIAIGSLAYAFSSFGVYYSDQIVFHSFYALMPLYFLAIECYFSDNKKVPFAIMAAVMLFTNWYFFYILSICTVLYFVYRYYLINGNLNGMWKSAFKLIGVYFIGVLITGVLLIPTLMYMKESSRFATNIENFYEPITYVHLLISLLLPEQILNITNPISGKLLFSTISYQTSEIPLFTTAIGAVLLPQVFIDKNKKFKKASIMLIALLIVIALIPRLSLVMHGFSNPSFRFFVFGIFVCIYIYSRYIDNLEQVNYELLKKTVITYIAVLISASALALYLKGFGLQLNLASLSLTCILAYAVLYVVIGVLFKKINSQKIALLIIAELGIVSAVYNNSFVSMNRDKEFFNKYFNSLEIEKGTFAENINYLDQDNYSSYYRIYVDSKSVLWDISKNLSCYYKYNGTMTYDSTFEPTWSDFDRRINGPSSHWIFDIKDADVLDFLNTKYLIVSKGDKLPEGDYSLIDDNFNGFLKLYENNNYIPLGRTVSSVDVMDNFNKEKLNEVLFVEQDDLVILGNLINDYYSELNEIEYYGNEMHGYIQSDGGVMLLTLPYSKGWKVYLNGEITELYKADGRFIAMCLPGGDVSVDMYFMPPGFKSGAIMSVGGFALLTVLILLENMKRTQKRIV
ncbi:MAG: YfhO family protein [Erysipelotrichaceae bacterium]|nr:YfhO family protein [Erysipelotrichaceae bacterium]